MEEVGADDVAPEAPAVAIALVDQPAGAESQLVDVADLEARVVVAGPVALDEAHDVVIAAAFAAAHESDDVARAVGEAHADDPRVEVELLFHVRRVAQRVAETARLHVHIAPRMARHARAFEMAGMIDPPVRRGKPRRGLRDAHVDEHLVDVAEPQTITRRFLRRVEQLVTVFLEALLKRVETRSARTESDVMEPLLRTFDQDDLVLLASVTAHDDALAVLASFQPKVGVEPLADRGIRNREGDVLEGADGHRFIIRRKAEGGR